MGWSLRRFSLTKAVPLAISSGTTAQVEHLELTFSMDGYSGRGETGGFDTGHRAFSTDQLALELEALLPKLGDVDPADRQQLAPLLQPLSPPARCAVDLALWDWWGQRLEQPVWRLFGLDGHRPVATSVTLGLGSVDAVLSRLQRWWRQLPATRIKLKLGSADGCDHDRALLEAVAQALQEQAQQQQQPMELQVLDPDRDTAAFAALKPHCAMALVADESCWDLQDLLRLAPHVDGVNLKLLKSGGLSEAWLMAQVAQRLDLDLMIGCYSDSVLLNGAAAQLLPLIRWPDLDSHLNLVDDPYQGLDLVGDQLRAPAAAGLGISRAS